MTLKSERKVIKSIGNWRYEVSLSQDLKGLFHVESVNLLTEKSSESSFVDFNMASFAFDSKVENFEGKH